MTEKGYKIAQSVLCLAILGATAWLAYKGFSDRHRLMQNFNGSVVGILGLLGMVGTCVIWFVLVRNPPKR